MKRFLLDPKRGISKKLFAEVAGISEFHLEDVFQFQTLPLTNYVQVRVSKALKAWQNGEIAIMKNADRTKFVQYRRKPEPVMKRSMGLQLVNGELKINVGIKNKFDYSQPDLKEQFEEK
jgi:hypothetical protein